MAVGDLDGAADRLLREHGIATIAGGHHPAWGTANRIAPLGEDYLELLSVVDRPVGERTRLGRTLMELSVGGDTWFSVCVSDPGIDATAARLGLEVFRGSRTKPDGSVVSWRGAGTEDPARELWQPFFIAWDGPASAHPGRAAATHPGGASGIAWIEVGGDEGGLSRWLDDAELPISVHDGPERVQRVALYTEGGGEIVLP